MNKRLNPPFENDDKRRNASSSRLKWVALSVIIIAVIGVFALPAAVIKWSFGYDLGTFKPNEIGDTIGGTLSPFIGLVSAILIYITIDQQIEANRKIQEQFARQEKAKSKKIIFEEFKSELFSLESEIIFFNIVTSNSDEFKTFFEKVLEEYSYTFISENKHRKLKKGVLEFFENYVEVLSLFILNVDKSDAYDKIAVRRIIFF